MTPNPSMHRTCQDGFRPPSRASFLSVGQLTIAFRRSPAESGRGRQFLRRMDFDFSFYSNDHSPIHVHVRKGDGEAVFNVEGEVALRESQGLKLMEGAPADPES